MAFTQKPHGRVTRDPEQGDLEASFIQWHVVYFGRLGSGLLKLATGFWAKILDLTHEGPERSPQPPVLESRGTRVGES